MIVYKISTSASKFSAGDLTANIQPNQSLYKNISFFKKCLSSSKRLKYSYKKSIAFVNSKRQNSSKQAINQLREGDDQDCAVDQSKDKAQMIGKKNQIKMENSISRHQSFSFCKDTNVIIRRQSENCIQSRIYPNQKSTSKLKLNPYTKKEYLYSRNISRQKQQKTKVVNHSSYIKFEKSCKITSFQLVNPLQKYIMREKMNRTNSTLPSGFINEEQSNSFLSAKQVNSKRPLTGVIYRQNNRKEKSLIGQLMSGKEPDPSPWQLQNNQEDIFYLKVQQQL